MIRDPFFMLMTLVVVFVIDRLCASDVNLTESFRCVVSTRLSSSSSPCRGGIGQSLSMCRADPLVDVLQQHCKPGGHR